MPNKQCTKCEQIKDLDDFYRTRITSENRHSYCKQCSAENARASYHRQPKKNILAANIRKQKKIEIFGSFVDGIKLYYGCCFCGEKSHPCCLDCHHFDPESKSVEIAVCVSTASKERLFDELVKCIVVCSNCHRKVHRNLLVPRKENLICLELFDTELILNQAGKRKRANRSERKTLRIIDGISVRVPVSTAKDPKNLVKPTKIIWPSKEELHKLVWDKPTAVLAKELGVGDTTIGKWCKKYGITKPPRGYWQKKNAV